MSKFPMPWHERCLAASKAYLASKEEELMRLQDEIERTRARVQEREYQITLAKSEGRTEFDPETYGKKRKRKS